MRPAGGFLLIQLSNARILRKRQEDLPLQIKCATLNM